MEKCNLCPRHCNVDRSAGKGFCKLNNTVKVALAKLHFGEEPVISGTKGSGTIFFSGCNLKCVYCQNYELSHNNFGKEISVERLAEIFKELENKGAHNINLVSPTPYAKQIVEALKIYRPSVPIVYNTHGYDDVTTLEMLKDYIDIYLTDFKYAFDALGKEYSLVDNYAEKVVEAINQMKKNQPVDVIENGLMKQGVIIRHLVLSNHTDNSVEVLKTVAERWGKETIISVMSQYTPCGKSYEFDKLSRPISKLEYKRVVAKINSLGLTDGFVQELTSSGEEEIPLFNCDGV